MRVGGSCGVDHGWAVGCLVGEDVAAGVGGAARGVFGCAGAGECGGVGEVDADLEYLWFGVQDGGQAGDEVFGCEESSAFAEVQPESFVDLVADLSELGSGRADVEESVALAQGCAFGGGKAVVDHQEPPDSRYVGAAVEE